MRWERTAGVAGQWTASMSLKRGKAVTMEPGEMELTAEGPGEARADHRMDRVFGLSRALKLRVANARAGEEPEVLRGVRVVLPHQIHLSHLPVVLLHASQAVSCFERMTPRSAAQ